MLEETVASRRSDKGLSEGYQVVKNMQFLCFFCDNLYMEYMLEAVDKKTCEVDPMQYKPDT